MFESREKSVGWTGKKYQTDLKTTDRTKRYITPKLDIPPERNASQRKKRNSK